MIVLHAIWTFARLHVWGEQRCEPRASACAEFARAQARGSESHFAVEVEELRRIVGDVWDSLLVSGAGGEHLTLQLPCRAGTPLPSWSGSPMANGECEMVNGEKEVPDVNSPFRIHHSAFPPALSLQPCCVPTLSFDPADAVDLLTGSPSFERHDIHLGASLRFWSCMAELVLELLAKQRFVPAVHRAQETRAAGPGADGRCRGYWRVVVDDEQTSQRLRSLIVSMPPICRAQPCAKGPVQASALVENFLWTTVDALVRRCLEGDELAHALQERLEPHGSAQIRWLRSLVQEDPALSGTSDEQDAVFETVQGWLSRLEPLAQDRTCRTCFRLHPPRCVTAEEPDASARSWSLTLHVQAVDDPDLLLDATSLWGDEGHDPMILKRPFGNARAQLRSDVAVAARNFPPLAPLAQASGPVGCRLTLDEAYRFLRDAAPIFKHEGFGVWLPRWWQTDRKRLRMHLHLGPTTAGGGAPPAAMRLDTLIRFDWRIALGDVELSAEEITELAAAKEPLVRVRGEWTEVQPLDVQAALAFLKKRSRGQATVLEALRKYYSTDDSETGLSIAGLRAHGWVDTLLHAADRDEPIEDLPQPEGFHGTLRHYQLRGLQWLRFLSKHGLGACLADDMGLGKTIQLIALWLCERALDDGHWQASSPVPGGSVGPTLLVVPMSLVGNWHREIARFAPSLKVMVHHGLERLTGQEFLRAVGEADVVISTYALTYRDLDHLDQVDWHRIALDEAQNIKNPASKQSVAIRALRATHRVALTGTPVENRLSELWSILDFLNPGYLGGATEFRRRFAVPIERHHDTDRAERLRHLIRPFLLRRRKDDPNILPELPEKMEMKVFCNLTREQAGLYEATVQDMLGQIDRSGGIQRRGLILATLMRLKQICNHPAQFLSDGSALPHRSGKCDRLTEMLEEVLAEGDCALIFTQFKVMGTLLQRLLQEALDRKVLFLHGGTTQKERDALVQRFQDDSADTPLFILSLKAGGFGLNLTAASHVFHFDRWWNPAVEDQATDRAHRIGQDKQVQVHKFVCIGTLEERISDLLEHKRNLADTIIGGGEQWLTELGTDALRKLFVLSREAVAED